MRCRWNFPDCLRSVWKWASVLLFFTLSLMCDFTNGSCFITAGTQKERCEAYLWQSLSWVAEHSVTYLMSIMHLCCVLCLLWREPHNIIHNAWIMTGHKNPSIHAGGRKDSLNYVENWLVSTSLSSQLKVVDHVYASCPHSWKFLVVNKLFQSTHCIRDRCL